MNSLAERLLMPTREEVKTIVKNTVKSSIVAFCKKKIKAKPKKFQVLDLIIPKERKIRSTVGGLETSLGTTLWEPLSKSLAAINGFEVISDKLERPNHMPSSLNNTLQTIIDGRKERLVSYTAEYCHQEIKRICQEFRENRIEHFKPASKGFGVDMWFRKEGVNYFFDTKTVQLNVGGFSKCMEQVLYWYAFFYARYPDQQAQSRIVFPYNPYQGDFWLKSVGQGKPLERDTEAWVQDQFWDFCSGVPDTYTIIREAFTELEISKEISSELESIFYG